MQSKTQLPHALISLAYVHADQGTEFLQSSALNEGMCVSEFFAISDVCPESLRRIDETVARITSADATPSDDIQPDPWWYAIPAALSWVMNFLIEGLAAYGAAMHPGYFQPHETDHADWRVPDNPLSKTRRDREVVASSIDPGDVSSVRAYMPRLRAGRPGSMMTKPDDLDNRILQDIGCLHSKFSSIPEGIPSLAFRQKMTSID